MDEYLLFILDKLILTGFLSTRAPLYIDIIICFLAVLPLLSGISIFFAIRKRLKLHQSTQSFLFFLTLISLALFAYMVHYSTGLKVLLQETSLDSLVVLSVLIAHVIVSIVTLTLWMFALIYAHSDRRRRGLPGIYSSSHTQTGKRVFKGILLTALSSVGIYWVLFIS